MKENKNISHQLFNGEGFFKSIFDQAGIGIGITDLKGNIVKVNTVFARLLEYSENELVGMTLKEITHPDDYDLDKSSFESLLAGKQNSYTIKKRYLKKDSESIYTRISVSLIKNAGQQTDFCIGLVEDISDQIDFENKYAKEKLFLDTIMKYSPDSIYFKDTNSRFIMVDEGHCRKFGVDSLNEIIGKTDRYFFKEEHAKAAFENEQEIIKTAKPILGIEEKETWNDGSITWVSTSKAPLFDESGNIVGTFGISRDITKQKKFEAELKESQERYKSLSGVTFEGILIHDQGICIDANSSFLKLTGYSLEEIIGKNVIDIAVHKNSLNTVYKNVRDEYSDPYEAIAVKKDGTEFIAEIESRNISYNDKMVRVAAVRDITKRRKQEKVHSALYKISQAVSAIDDIHDLYKKIHEIVGTLMKAENFYIALYDKAKNMMSFPYFVDEYDAPPAPRKFGNGLTEYIIRADQDMLIDSELDKKLRDNGETDLIGELCKIWLGVRLKVKENLIGAIVVQDYNSEHTYGEDEKEILTFVSEQIALAIDKKRNEEKLIKYSAELKELVASKDKFFSIVAHDLKSPFTALLGYSEMIASEYMEMTKEELKEFAVNMNEVAKKTFTLLENLLEWSRIQTGRMKFSPENLSLFKISQQVVDLYIENARKKGIFIKNRVYPEHELFADSNMLFTILRNLTSNALKFTHSGGEILLMSRKKEGFIEVVVKDNGVGINSEDKEKLFRIDIHHSEIGTEQEKGTGLGLILCKELVEKNGGKIWVDSEPGKGSSFIFSIPASTIGM